MEDDTTINVAIVGRPNVGKSSLLNRLAGESRAIVSDIPGTTRDAVDAIIVQGNDTFRFIDTAGIRRKKKVDYGNEFFMVNRAFKAIRRADVVLLVVDVTEGVTEQDRQLAQRIADDGRLVDDYIMSSGTFLALRLTRLSLVLYMLKSQGVCGDSEQMGCSGEDG